MSDLLERLEAETHRSGMWADTCELLMEAKETLGTVMRERDDFAEQVIEMKKTPAWYRTQECLKLQNEIVARAETAKRERDEARAKLAEYERRQGDAENWADALFAALQTRAYSSSKVKRDIMQTTLTAAHARGYAAGVEAEREECAKIAGPQYTDCQFEELTPTGKTLELMRADIAAAIRNRSAT